MSDRQQSGSDQNKIKFWAEIKGNAAKLVLHKQNDLRLGGSGKKDLGTVANILLNELADMKGIK